MFHRYLQLFSRRTKPLTNPRRSLSTILQNNNNNNNNSILHSTRSMTADEKYNGLYRRTDSLTEQVRMLNKQVQLLKDKLSNTNDNDSNVEVSPALQQLQTMNQKLKYQKTMLERTLTEEKEKCARKMFNVHTGLVSLFQAAIVKAFPECSAKIPVVLTLAQNVKFGDYQCNSAMAATKILKGNGINLAPPLVAKSIVENIPANDIIKKVEIAGPGFINIHLKKGCVIDIVNRVNREKVYPPGVPGTNRRVVIDFSSPNIAKQMHVGHLRSTIIGESLSRLLEFVGLDVLRLNHVGDWGTQFGMLIAHLEDEFPNYKTEVPPIKDLQEFYKASKKRFDEDEVFKKRAYQRVVQLQGGDADVLKAWGMICDASRKEFQRVYDRLEVTLTERGESFYNPLMPKVIDELKASGKCKLADGDDGRWIMHVPEMKVPLILAKSDGGFTYDTSDMAAIKHRLVEERADWLIYVVDGGQGDHFKQIFGGAQEAGWYNPTAKRVDHVSFGVVLGEDKKKFKTRSGETVKLSDLMDEGLKRSMEKLLEKGRDKELTQEELAAAQTSVAYGCIKYADLSHNRIMDYVFSFDKMLDDKGNTAVYLLYAYTRVRSIQRRSNVPRADIDKHIRDVSISLEHEKEWKLGKMLCRYPEVVVRCMEELVLHPLCEYLYELAGTLTEFYDECQCIEKNKQGEIVSVDMNRMALLEAVARIFESGFYIVGIKPVSRM